MTMKYLLDSNIIIHLFRDAFGVRGKIQEAGWDNCCISQITQIELLYGAELSANREKNYSQVYDFLSSIHIVPIDGAIPLFCQQKAMLRKCGTMIDDFDLLIATTAVANNLVMVTENVKHFAKVDGIAIENWVCR